jgi:hypothetical protein
MKKKMMVVLLLACGLCNTANATLYVETFSNNNAGWEAVGVNDSGAITTSDAIYNSSGGNLGGYISGSLDSGQPRLYGLQPSQTSIWGDMTGDMLTTDFKVDGTVTGPVGAMVRFYVGTYTGGYNYFVTNDTYSWNPNNDTSWTTHQVSLLVANFIEWPNQAAHNKTFGQIIAAPEDIGLVFSGNFTGNTTLGFTGSGRLMLDNFGTVNHLISTIPEPATIGLLGLGTLTLRGKRRA